MRTSDVRPGLKSRRSEAVDTSTIIRSNCNWSAEKIVPIESSRVIDVRSSDFLQKARENHDIFSPHTTTKQTTCTGKWLVSGSNLFGSGSVTNTLSGGSGAGAATDGATRDTEWERL